MNLIKFDPFTRTNTYLPNVFDDFFNRNIGDVVGSDLLHTVPAVNVVETEKDFRLEIAAPGMKKEDFKVSVEKNRLLIGAELEGESSVKEEKYTRREFSYRSFNRNFMLPGTVNKDAIVAQYLNGVLVVTVPKKAEVVQESRSRVIEIG